MDHFGYTDNYLHGTPAAYRNNSGYLINLQTWHISCSIFIQILNNCLEDLPMKKMLSTIVAALVAVSFAGFAFAADMKSDVKTDTTTTSAAGEVKTEKKEVKKSVKKKHGKKVKKTMKKDVTKTVEPAPTAAPAAK